MRFIDEIEVILSSGKGGDGCVSFQAGRHNPRGGPDGGDGGRGGDLILEATANRNTLSDFRRNKIYKAGTGEDGQSSQMYGAGGEHMTLMCPIGTMIYHAKTGELLADLSESGMRFVLKGGQGGLGNMHFKSSTMRSPRTATAGGEPKEVPARLELKLIADVGLLGYPNAGKSTFLRRVSNARPKVADYPFTTLVPQLGVVPVGEDHSFVIADIPGLVEGAAEGVGLGHQFLRHVERCPAFVHLVAPDDWEGEPFERWAKLNDELRRYAPALADRPQVVALTKKDSVPDDVYAERLAALRQVAGPNVVAVSSLRGDGLKELLYALWALVQAGRAAGAPEPVERSERLPSRKKTVRRRREEVEDDDGVEVHYVFEGYDELDEDDYDEDMAMQEGDFEGDDEDDEAESTGGAAAEGSDPPKVWKRLDTLFEEGDEPEEEGENPEDEPDSDDIFDDEDSEELDEDDGEDDEDESEEEELEELGDLSPGDDEEHDSDDDRDEDPAAGLTVIQELGSPRRTPEEVVEGLFGADPQGRRKKR